MRLYLRVVRTGPLQAELDNVLLTTSQTLEPTYLNHNDRRQFEHRGRRCSDVQKNARRRTSKFRYRHLTHYLGDFDKYLVSPESLEFRAGGL